MVPKAIIGNSRLVILVWVVALVVALFAGGAARSGLHSSDLEVPGTDGANAAELSRSQFGSTISMAILLKGPQSEVDRRGPPLVRRLERIEGVQVLSPWAPGGKRTTRGQPGRALLLLQVERPFEEIGDETTPEVRRLLEQEVKPPLQADLTGLAPLVSEINDVSLKAMDRGERVALPILAILLLLVFRSPIAALIPALCGFVVIRIGTAVMAVANMYIEVDALALNMVTMMGLALGVDYSLLIVSRFREELGQGAEPARAARTALSRAGRTVLFAGGALAMGMLIALAIAPGSLLVSATTGVIVAAVLSVLAAMTAIPAALALLGNKVNWLRWQIRPDSVHPWVRISQRLIKRPGVAALGVILPLLLISAPAVAMNTGPPNIKNLPGDNPVRRSFEAFESELGAGWAAPFEVIVFADDSQVTTRSRLRRLERFQAKVARRPGVQAVFGPAAIGRLTAPLVRLSRGLPRELARSRSDLGRLAKGLGQAGKGTAEIRQGLADAAQGSGDIASGSAAAGQGASAITQGLAAAEMGTKELVAGLREAENGVRRLSKGSEDLLGPMADLAGGLSDADADVEKKLSDPTSDAQTEVRDARNAIASLPESAKQEPGAQNALDALAGASSALDDLESSISEIQSQLSAASLGADEISAGLKELSSGLEQLDAGVKQLNSSKTRNGTTGDEVDSDIGALTSGAEQIDQGLGQLSGASGSLSQGIEVLTGGAQELQSELESGSTDALGLKAGIELLRAGVVRYRGRTARSESEIRSSGTNMKKTTESGYFVLAGLEGSPTQALINSSFAINVGRGGNTGRVFIVPTSGPFDPATAGLRKRLRSDVDKLGEKTRAQAVIGGPAAVLDDFDRVTESRFPFLILALVMTTILVLIFVFRSPVLAMAAVLLNLVTVGAAVGILTLAFQGSAPLGGPGYLDAISLSGIFAIIFGLSIDYEVFLIARIVEGRYRTGTTDGAIAYGLERTAGIITGAAAIMTGVFVAFALSDVANTRQFGVGLTVAVILDATVVRLVLLPALIRLAGERTWWVPRWLDRVLPDIAPH